MTGPLVKLAGVTTVAEVSETTLNAVPATPLKRTPVAPVKPVPVRVTVTPPAPVTGVIEATFGAGELLANWMPPALPTATVPADELARPKTSRELLEVSAVHVIASVEVRIVDVPPPTI